MPDDSPLSLESAIGLLRVKPEEEGNAETLSDTNDAPAAEEDAAVAAEAENHDAPADNDESAAESDEEDTPSDDAGETEDEGGDQGDALPPIEAPSSWKAEEKAVWGTLPRAAQEAIQRREQDRTNELRNLQNSTAERNKAADAEVTRLKGISERIGKLVDSQTNDLVKEFPELRSEADIQALAANDPGRFAQFQAKLMAIGAAQQAQADAQKEVDAKAAQTQRETLAKAKDAFLETFPEWKDPDVARREIKELQDFAIKHGAPEQAARNNLDPVLYKVAKMAMKWEQAQAKKAAAVKNVPPRVIKPGASDPNPGKAAQVQARQAKLNRLSETGDIEDAIGLLRLS